MAFQPSGSSVRLALSRLWHLEQRFSKSALGSDCSAAAPVDLPKIKTKNKKYNPKTLRKTFIAQPPSFRAVLPVFREVSLLNCHPGHPKISLCQKTMRGNQGSKAIY
jgi:hypothetical protein